MYVVQRFLHNNNIHLQAPSLSTQSSLRVPSSDGPPMPLLVQLSPHEEVSFEPSSGGGELVARISVKNIAGRPIAYKVRSSCHMLGYTLTLILIAVPCYSRAAYMVHGCKVNPPVWSIFDWSKS